MSLSTCGLAVFACVAIFVLQCAVDSTDALPTTDQSLESSTPLLLSSRDTEDEVLGTSALTTSSTSEVVGDYAVKETALGKYKITITPIILYYTKKVWYKCTIIPIQTYLYQY